MNKHIGIIFLFIGGKNEQQAIVASYNVAMGDHLWIGDFLEKVVNRWAWM